MYNAVVYDAKGEEMPITIHLLHELMSSYYADTARVTFLKGIIENNSRLLD
jgi:hypothetical protein